MKKRFGAILLVFALLCNAVACNQSDAGEEGNLTQKNDGPVNIGVYDMYDLETYMIPIWDGRVVHNETVMFLGMDDKASLLYDADEIISVRSYDLKTEYVQGVDFDYADGKLFLLEGTRIPCMDKSNYYTSNTQYSMLVTKGNSEPDATGTYTYWGEGDTMTKWQVAVTYKHSQFWDGYSVECFANRHQDLLQKLQNGEDVTFVFYGDSITYGANASFMVGMEPFAPTWSQLFTQYIAKQYGYTVKYIQNEFATAPVPEEDTVCGTNGTITYYNPSVGGWSVEQGYQNVEDYVNTTIDKYGCDLFTVAFGMNNAALATKKFVQYTEGIIKRVQNHAPDTDVVMVSTMVPNPEATNGWYGNQEQFEEEMITSANAYYEKGTNCSVACMTSMSLSVLNNKRFRDYTGNNINHPNDFMSRLYAQVMVEAVFGYKNILAFGLEE